MAAKKNASLTVQLIAIDNIRIERSLQSRTSMTKEYIRQFSEAILRGDVFPPVEVFWDGKEYWLADGFHRAEAHRKAGIIDIRCNIHLGNQRDAVVYSAGANQQFSIPRTDDDKRRAAYMLFDDSEWLRQSGPVIGRHIGVGKMTVARWRVDYCTENGIPVPETIVRADGVEFPTSPALKTGPPKIRRYPDSRTGRPSQFRMRFKGKTHYLGHSEKEAVQKRDEIVDLVKRDEEKRVQLEMIEVLRSHLTALRIYNRGADVGEHGLGSVRIITGGVVVGAKLTSQEDICTAVGRVMLARAKYLPCGRAIILCYDSPKGMALEIARSIGIEFLKPRELAESLKAERAE